MSTAEGHPNILIVEEPPGGFKMEPEGTIRHDEYSRHDVILVRKLDGSYGCLKHRSANKEGVEVNVLRQEAAPSKPRRWSVGNIVRPQPKPAAMPLLGASD